MELVDLAIVGGGAAGLAVAIFAAEAAGANRRIVVLDGAKSLGAKILVSGGGRCNVTHDEVLPDDFNGSKPVVRNILAAFDAAAAVRWFASLGVELKREETGKLFPITDSARTVLNALLNRCEELNVTLQAGSRVTEIIAHSSGGAGTAHHAQQEAGSASATGFDVICERGSIHARRVIICTGGRSLPRSGSDGAAWEMMRKLGHTVTPTYAALVPLVLDARMFHAEISGIAQEVELAVSVSGKRIDQRTGSLLWTHFGISGPVVMDASRHWTLAQESGQQPTMTCNFIPGDSFESAEQRLLGALAARPRATILNHLSPRLYERVAGALLRHLGINATTTAAQLSREARHTLLRGLTALHLPVMQHRGWNYAEVTAGGVPLNEINYRTMESRKVPGLYLAGEILDCDGRIGGFNFQWAWATGYLAGGAAGRKLCETT